MRITRQHLRQIIREELERSIDEMAYAGSLGTIMSDDPGEGLFADEDEDPVKANRSALKYSRSKLFNTLAVKHYANLPFNVWTATVIGGLNLDQMDGYKRGVVMDLEEGFDVLDDLQIGGRDRVGPNDLVILYGATSTAKDFNASPWMIIHAYFDQSEDFTELCPTYRILRDIGEFTVPGDIAGVPADDFYNLVGRASEFFTMRSARVDALSGADAAAEAVTQELLDRRGFHVNHGAVPPELAPALRVFMKLVKQAGQEFRENAPGKMIAVAAN